MLTTIKKYFYRPQMKFGQGNAFTPVCHYGHKEVYPSMHWAGDVYSSMQWDMGCVTRGLCDQRVCVTRGVWPGGCTLPWSPLRSTRWQYRNAFLAFIILIWNEFVFVKIPPLSHQIIDSLIIFK